jgi:hypothetical protein
MTCEIRQKINQAEIALMKNNKRKDEKEFSYPKKTQSVTSVAIATAAITPAIRPLYVFAFDVPSVTTLTQNRYPIASMIVSTVNAKCALGGGYAHG